jgi:hypothetical protein
LCPAYLQELIVTELVIEFPADQMKFLKYNLCVKRSFIERQQFGTKLKWGSYFVDGIPLIQWVPGALSQRVKRPKRETDHSPPSSAEVKNAWNYTSTLPIRLHGVVLN